MENAVASDSLPRLGILAGSGELPKRLVDACIAQQRAFFILGFDGSVDEAFISHHPHAIVRLGAVGEGLAHLKNAGVGELVLAGRIPRPGIASLRPDAVGAKLLARVGKAFLGGDNTLLEAVLDYLEEQGFRIIGADDVLSSLLAPKGLIGKIRPTREAEADIAKGVPLAYTIGNLDIGQAIVMQKGYVLGVEAAEGTDNLILRCNELRRPSPYGGVLIKVKKPNQERRIDLPTIGPDTVLNAAKAGLSGIAVEAGGTIILDRKEVSLKADALGIFIVGFTAEGSEP